MSAVIRRSYYTLGKNTQEIRKYNPFRESTLRFIYGLIMLAAIIALNWGAYSLENRIGPIAFFLAAIPSLILLVKAYGCFNKAVYNWKMYKGRLQGLLLAGEYERFLRQDLGIAARQFYMNEPEETEGFYDYPRFGTRSQLQIAPLTKRHVAKKAVTECLASYQENLVIWWDAQEKIEEINELLEEHREHWQWGRSLIITPRSLFFKDTRIQELLDKHKEALRLQGIANGLSVGRQCKWRFPGVIQKKMDESARLAQIANQRQSNYTLLETAKREFHQLLVDLKTPLLRQQRDADAAIAACTTQWQHISAKNVKAD